MPSTTAAWRQAAMARRAPSRHKASGFSQKTCFPAPATATTWSTCWVCGVASATALTDLSANASARLLPASRWWVSRNSRCCDGSRLTARVKRSLSLLPCTASTRVLPQRPSPTIAASIICCHPALLAGHAAFRRPTMTHQAIAVNRISGALGAEISGVDLSQKLGDETIAEIRQVLRENQVIFFRDQKLTPDQHLAFGRRFGKLQVHDFVEGLEDNQEILEVRKEEYETRNFGG